MSAIANMQKAKSDLSSAQEFMGMIGKEQRTTAKAKGHLWSIKTATTIYYQSHDGASNYHTNEAFESAFKQAVFANFGMLALLAIGILEQSVSDKIDAAKLEYQKLFGEALQAPTQEETEHAE